MSRAAPAAILLLAVGWLVTLWIAPWSDERVNDLFVYRIFAEPVLDGWYPYRDIPFEYPPGAGPAIALPGLVTNTEDGFRAAFAGWTFAFAAMVVLLCGALAARTGGIPRRALLAAALLPLLCGAMVRTHFDLVPVAALLGALLLLAAARPRSGMLLLGFAAMTKGFPLVAAPVALAWLAAHTDRRTLVQATAALLAGLAFPAAVALAFSPSGAIEAVQYHLERPIQVESLPATALYALGGAERVQSHRSDGLEHAAGDAIVVLLALAMIGVIALLTVLARRGGAREMVLASLAAVTAFAALGKVLSPQFMIWIVPLGALAYAWRLHALAAAVAVAAILTQIEFPVRYADLVAGEAFPAVVIAIRNVVLLAVVALALRALWPGNEELLDRDGRSAAALDEHAVQPRVVI